MNNNQLLRFTTAGSVDDGKSTLIGRLLYDSKSIFEDQLSSVQKASQRKGSDKLDLAMFTDGLRDEREQGITIDVAYRYFTTPKRKFIIADTPGHIEYTRNMVTGASTANAAILLIDARHGIVEQTKRHSYIASLLQIPHVIVCVNKMDLVGYQQNVFDDIVSQYQSIASKMMVKDVQFVPISALNGDNVVNRSENMNWYQGAPLLHILEHLHIGSDINKKDLRFPIQTVIRPQSTEHLDYRGYAGRLSSGIVRKGDEVMVLPSGLTSIVTSIDTIDGELNEAFAPMSVSLSLADAINVSRGDMIVKVNNRPQKSQEFNAMICWLGHDEYQPKTKFFIQHSSREEMATIKEVVYKMDVNSLQRIEDDKQFGMNDIVRVSIKTAGPLMIDNYSENRNTGSFILIDPQTNETVAAGMII